MKQGERVRAITLRRSGATYREIRKKVPVAKSTLSLWLRSVCLTNRQRVTLTERRIAAQRRGAEARRLQRIERTERITRRAVHQVGVLTRREILLVGTALYWAEGSKEKRYRPGSGMVFSNTDPDMIAFFIQWLLVVCGVEQSSIYFELHLHNSHRHRLSEVMRFWMKCTGFAKDAFSGVYWKRTHAKGKRHNTDAEYFGVLRVRVRRSSSLVRRAAGWACGIARHTKH